MSLLLLLRSSSSANPGRHTHSRTTRSAKRRWRRSGVAWRLLRSRRCASAARPSRALSADDHSASGEAGSLVGREAVHAVCSREGSRRQTAAASAAAGSPLNRCAPKRALSVADDAARPLATQRAADGKAYFLDPCVERGRWERLTLLPCSTTATPPRLGLADTRGRRHCAPDCDGSSEVVNGVADRIRGRLPKASFHRFARASCGKGDHQGRVGFQLCVMARGDVLSRSRLCSCRAWIDANRPLS